MNYEHILYEKRGRIAYITINRPRSMNALNSRCHLELRQIFHDYKDDKERWVAIVTGAGPHAFCAGADLKEPPRTNATTLPFAGITRDFECFKPIIAAVNGVAFGGGVELMLAADIAIAADHAKFGLTEPRFGAAAGGSGLHRLVRQIPLKRAMGLILTGERIDAHQAHALGLINEVVPADRLLPAAERWAHEILACSPSAVRTSKEIAQRGLRYAGVEDALQVQDELLLNLRETEDFKEGRRAFSEKRKPEWSGR